jgi:hypothetical protein
MIRTLKLQPAVLVLAALAILAAMAVAAAQPAKAQTAGAHTAIRVTCDEQLDSTGRAVVEFEDCGNDFGSDNSVNPAGAFLTGRPTFIGVSLTRNLSASGVPGPVTFQAGEGTATQFKVRIFGLEDQPLNNQKIRFQVYADASASTG